MSRRPGGCARGRPTTPYARRCSRLRPTGRTPSDGGRRRRRRRRRWQGRPEPGGRGRSPLRQLSTSARIACPNPSAASAWSARACGTRHGHVRVPDRLDLLDSVLGREHIEPAEEVIEQGDDSVRVGALGPRGKADDVGEDDGRRRDDSVIRSSPCLRRDAIDDGIAFFRSSSISPPPNVGGCPRSAGAGT